MRTQIMKWTPTVNAALCNGCNRCVEVCDSGTLTLRNGVALVAWPDSCQSDAECVRVCPQQAMRMEWMAMDGDRTRGKWVIGGRAWPGRVRGCRQLRVG
ncbi:MAG: 4Fe-4S binding protein [Verrucomicrobia bacterium]|nr:4Fe-4S binding protein [Verrucomicrobiota bacterium]